MQDSEIQKKCLSIYRKHKKALDMIFKYIPDRLTEIDNCLKNIIEADNELDLDYSVRGEIRFIPKAMDLKSIQIHDQNHEVYGKFKRVLLFNIFNEPERLTLYLTIFPGPREIREELHELAKNNHDIFNAGKKLFPQFNTIYKRSLLSPKEYEGKEIDDIRNLIKNKLDIFKTNELPKIINVLKQFEVSQNNQKE